jgi:flagellar protein FliS
MKIVTRTSLDAILSASPSRQIVMLYDEAMSALRTAVMAVAAEDIETRCNAVTTATEIVGYLYMTLDEANGGDVAQNLGALYGHIISRLPRVNLYNEVEAAEEAIALLEPLRDSWAELDNSMGELDADLSFDPAFVNHSVIAEAALAR